jgi:hypothetical protein
MNFIHWLNHALGNDYGLRYGQFSFYNMWSGIGGAAPDILLIIGLVTWYIHRTCHIHRCWRPARHQVGTFRVCRRHHPGLDGKVTIQHVADAHEQAGR